MTLAMIFPLPPKETQNWQSGKTYSTPRFREEICYSSSGAQENCRYGLENHKDSSRDFLPVRTLDEELYWIEYTIAGKSHQHLREGFLQVGEQFSVRKDYGEHP